MWYQLFGIVYSTIHQRLYTLVSSVKDKQFCIEDAKYCIRTDHYDDVWNLSKFKTGLIYGSFKLSFHSDV